jgi:alpha-glucosidase
MKKLILLLLLAVAFATVQLFPQNFTLKSPDEKLEITIQISDEITWSAVNDNKAAITEAAISMQTGIGLLIGSKPKLSGHELTEVDETIHAAVPLKNTLIKDHYRQYSFHFEGNYSLHFRVYDDGVAYRFETNLPGEVEIVSEQLDVLFPAETCSWFAREKSMYSHFEQNFVYSRLDTISPGAFSALPVLFDAAGQLKICITESGQHDYPAMFLAAGGGSSIKAIFPKYVLENEPNNQRGPDRNEIITKEADFIAKTNGNRTFPWRIFIITNDDRKLAASNLAYQLATPPKLDDTDWIKPGKVAWDWYNANNLFGVDFKTGLNTDTYKYYIDFASQFGIEYVILDEGWTKSTTEILDFNPDMDVPLLIEYGKKSNVGIILWVLWKPLNENMEEILDTYQRWGAKGIKVDFMQRADQYMVSSYEIIAREAANRQLLVDFHGSFKPNGLNRTYPNVLSYEGVRGNEHNKWSALITPEHNVTLPFTRMVAGPMDYTPGAMRNATQKDFHISFERPVSLGARCHQIAMYIVFESPLQMLCESPSTYLRELESVEFIAKIPTLWDETIVLEAAVSDYIVVARRNGANWYIGAMTDWTAREFQIDLSFLPEGNFEIEIMRDGINADRFAEDYQKELLNVDKNTKLTIYLASGGGWAGIIKAK